MGNKRFLLVARIRTTEYAALQAVLTQLIPQGTITATEDGLRAEGEMEGTSARDLNRTLLSAMRRIDRRATLRAEWTADGMTERFFDYTARGSYSR